METRQYGFYPSDDEINYTDFLLPVAVGDIFESIPLVQPEATLKRERIEAEEMPTPPKRRRLDSKSQAELRKSSEFIDVEAKEDASSEETERERKKKERREKNRLAAVNSRAAKKKAALEGAEKIEMLSAENDVLKKENAQLKAQLAEWELAANLSQTQHYGSRYSSTMFKPTTCESHQPTEPEQDFVFDL